MATVGQGDPAGLFRLADGYNGREEDGTYNTIGQSNPIIRCASGIEDEEPTDAAALLATLQSVAPRFGAQYELDDLTSEHGCIDLMAAQPLDTLSYSGDAPIVVIGGTNDPATPFRWAEEMAAAMGPSAALVSFTGEGHGQMLVSSCVTEIQAAVLADLVTPEDGTVCDPDPEIERPEWWATLPVPEGIDPAVDNPELNAALGLSPTDLFAEVRTASITADEVLEAYSGALDQDQFAPLGEQEPFPGVRQLVFDAPDGQFLSVLAFDQDDLLTPDLEGIAELIEPGKTLVLILTFSA